jgi:carboxymethylenebutenolidase
LRCAQSVAFHFAEGGVALSAATACRSASLPPATKHVRRSRARGGDQGESALAVARGRTVLCKSVKGVAPDGSRIRASPLRDKTGAKRGPSQARDAAASPEQSASTSISEGVCMSDVLDPNASTSPAFNRKAFVGLSAGAAAAVSAGAALAQTGADFGKPHPPLVASDDPAITAQHVGLVRPDVTLAAYAAWPKATAASTPGIVMVHHIWGLDSTIRDDVRRYAKAGYICIAANLYGRSNAPVGDGMSDSDPFRPAAAALTDNVVTGDLLAARNWIAAKAGRARIGITGFCMGGGYALKQLIGSTTYAAASLFYGDVRPGTPRGAPTTAETFAYVEKITTPVRGNYGERDTSIAAADVRTMFGRLRVPHELSIYPEAGHAFFDDTRASYVASAAADAWTKTLAWFHRYLA